MGIQIKYSLSGQANFYLVWLVPVGALHIIR